MTAMAVVACAAFGAGDIGFVHYLAEDYGSNASRSAKRTSSATE